MTRRTPATAPPTPERHAQLRVMSARGTGADYFVKLTASNGETLGTGETHPTFEAGAESHEAWIRAFVDVLEQLGYTVSPPAGALVDPMIDSDVPGELS